MKSKNQTRKPAKNKSFEIPLDYNLNEVIFNGNKSENLFENFEKSKKNNIVKNLFVKEDLAKNIVTTRKNVIKNNKKIAKKNQKRVKKCNKYILLYEKEERDIFLTIDRFNNNGKKTIVYFIDSFYPSIDGVLVVMENYIKYMKDFYNIVVCAPKHKNKGSQFDKYFVLYVNSIYIKKQGYDLAFPQLDTDFQKYISILKIDLIHLHSPFNMGSFGFALAKRRKIPCFATFHSQFKKNFYDVVKNEIIAMWLTKMILGVFKKATVALTMNPFAREIMREYGIKRKIEIIPNATNLVKKEFDTEFEEKILNRHKINKNIFNIIFIGRFVAVKNVYFLIDVLKDVYKSNQNFNFIFLGYGPEEQKMKRKCREYGLENIVKFTGRIDNDDEKAIIIKNSSLMFFPSCYETDSIVKTEVACYDVPTLCLENTALSSVIVDGRNGFVCKNDHNDCVNKLEFLIKNVDYVKKIGKNANLEIYFTWEKPCKMLHELYEKYLKSYYFKNPQKNED